MESLYLLIPIAIVIVAIAVAIFFWAVKSGQFDDLDTEAKRILFDHDKPVKKTSEQKELYHNVVTDKQDRNPESAGNTTQPTDVQSKNKL